MSCYNYAFDFMNFQFLWGKKSHALNAVENIAPFDIYPTIFCCCLYWLILSHFIVYYLQLYEVVSGSSWTGPERSTGLPYFILVTIPFEMVLWSLPRLRSTAEALFLKTIQYHLWFCLDFICGVEVVPPSGAVSGGQSRITRCLVLLLVIVLGWRMCHH